MVSSLIGPQYHEDQFWTFTESAPEHQTNHFDVPVVPTFSEDFEVSSFNNSFLREVFKNSYSID